VSFVVAITTLTSNLSEASMRPVPPSAAVAAKGAATRVTPGTLPALVTAARDAAQQISTKLGWSGTQRRAGIVPHLKDDDVEEQEHEVADDEEAAG
jgi:hypothetical protein